MSLYPGAQMWNDRLYPDLTVQSDPVIEDFLRDLDVVFTCETPYNYWLFERARELSVKTVLQFNFEFLDYSRNSLPEPDLFAAPSPWYLDTVREQLPGRNVQLLPVPVDREMFPYKPRTSLGSLLHTAGTVAMEDRNGTVLSAKAMDYIDENITLNIRSQRPIRDIRNKRNIKFTVGAVDSPAELYESGDVFLFPRKFGGLCLPIQEALSCGMPIIVSDCSPQTFWVPEELRVPAHKIKTIETRNTIDVWESDPRDIAEKILWLRGNPDKVIEYSQWADQWAQEHSWQSLKSVYLDVMSNL
jgi:glycosyltransferase involved in cell wall biosynthesis